MKQPRRNTIRLAERRASAAVRQAEHVQLTPAQRLAKLDQRLGKGVGATAERARLAELITKNVKAADPVVAEAVFGVAETKKEAKGSKKTRGQKQAKA